MSFKTTIKHICPRFLQKTATTLYRQRRILKYRKDEIRNPEDMKYYCPCCGLKIRDFIEADYLDAEHFNPDRYKNARQDVLCPACMSLPRHRILAAWLNKHQKIIQGKRVLYFAPEYSMMLWMNRNGMSYTTADLYNTADIRLDIQATGLSDASYDMIICNHVLEHVDDFRVALKEMYRILKPMGSFICSFPMDMNVDGVDEDPEIRTDEERYKRFGQSDHKRVFGLNADRLLKAVGFTVEIINGGVYPKEILPVIGPADYDMNRLFHCLK